jgi:hypothetical protein
MRTSFEVSLVGRFIGDVSPICYPPAVYPWRAVMTARRERLLQIIVEETSSDCPPVCWLRLLTNPTFPEFPAVTP